MSTDHLHALAIEVVGEGATIVSEDADGVFVLRVVTGGLEAPSAEEPQRKKKRKVTTEPKERPWQPWRVSVPSGPNAEATARERLFGIMLREHGDEARERHWWEALDDAWERSHGRHVPSGPREPKEKEPQPQYEEAAPRPTGPRTGRGAPKDLDASELAEQRARIAEEAER